MKKHLKLIVALVALATVSSCDIARQAQGAYNMVNCKYNFQSIGNVSVANLNLSGGLSLLDTPKIISLLSGNMSSIPVGMTVNLGVQNPNATEAFLSGLDYALSIDGLEFTRGAVARELSVAPGATGTLPLAMSFDVASLLKGDSREAVTNIVKNLIGMGSEASNVTLNIRPSFLVAGQKITSPVDIPINFSFGGAQ